ncbi:phospholipase A1-like [Athalia rosae]|uniref:phospholipase A1-like n=1 Tax=Athalia rosae TaxID=37344 RepID=UPI002033AE6D|nr:phospholipase A1-like [Athalia rosae]
MRPQSFSIFLAFLLNTDRPISGARGPIQDAIQSGAAAEYHREDCIWRKENEHHCPDPSVRVYLHNNGKKRIELKYDQHNYSEWLNNNYYDQKREDIFLIHGYNGGDGKLPMVILRDAYLKNGSYNVFVVDWGELGEAPCYPAAVANLRFIASCIAQIVTLLKNVGLSVPRINCVGHSLGAHLCGMLSNYLPFLLFRIFGLDPAKPLLRPGRPNRLDITDAEFVEVIHTNSGYYGENSREGHVDFCANGGKNQPFCENAERDKLCSHNWSICYMADSIDGRSELFAEACSGRCPPTRKIGPRSSNSLVIGHHTPVTTRGSFCVTTVDSPYCPKNAYDRGDERCCV